MDIESARRRGDALLHRVRAASPPGLTAAALPRVMVPAVIGHSPSQLLPSGTEARVAPGGTPRGQARQTVRFERFVIESELPREAVMPCSSFRMKGCAFNLNAATPIAFADCRDASVNSLQIVASNLPLVSEDLQPDRREY